MQKFNWYMAQGDNATDRWEIYESLTDVLIASGLTKSNVTAIINRVT